MMIKINGVDIKTPSKFEATISDVDGETTRNALGTLFRDRIGVKRKLQLEFPPLTQSEISTILTAVSDVFFTVTYPDPMSGVITKTFYVGDRSIPMYVYGNGTTQLLWEGLKMNFIEQ